MALNESCQIWTTDGEDSMYPITAEIAATHLTKPDVGSARQITVGLTTNSTPILVRRRSPPDIPFTRAPPTTVSAHASKPVDERHIE